MIDKEWTETITDERGFTLLEILVTLVVMSIALTLGAQALRGYWLAQSLPRAQGELSAQMRQLQQQTVSESHPFLFGVRFLEGSDEWAVVRYDLKTTSSADDVCTEERVMPMNGRVSISEVAFAEGGSIDLSKCPSSSGSSFLMFFAKGTATGGGVELIQEGTAKTAALCVGGLTARVSERASLSQCPAGPTPSPSP